MHPPICTSVPSLVLLAQKLTKPEDPTYSKFPLVWHVHLAPLGIGDSKSTYQRLMATCLPSLVHVHQLVWPADSSDSHMHCIGCKYLHVQDALQVIFLLCLKPCAKVYQCPEFGVASSKFNKLGGSYVKKLYPSGTCCLCLLSPLTTMAPAPLW